ncbi:hypothetical protein O9992_19325 [Vibrio lentus]|nr:hypothetical protein [Vibrio lentus]
MAFGTSMAAKQLVRTRSNANNASKTFDQGTTNFSEENLLQLKNQTPDLKNGHVWIVGMSGSGKTYHTQNTLIKPARPVDSLATPRRLQQHSGVLSAVFCHDTKPRGGLAGRKTSKVSKIIWQTKARDHVGRLLCKWHGRR